MKKLLLPVLASFLLVALSPPAAHADPLWLYFHGGDGSLNYASPYFIGPATGSPRFSADFTFDVSAQTFPPDDWWAAVESSDGSLLDLLHADDGFVPHQQNGTASGSVTSGSGQFTFTGTDGTIINLSFGLAGGGADGASGFISPVVSATFAGGASIAPFSVSGWDATTSVPGPPTALLLLTGLLALAAVKLMWPPLPPASLR